jgi:hypothetical protein
MTAYLPKLFIREIGNASSSQIYRVIEDLGFGRVTRINYRGGNNAIVFVNWDIPNTTATRILLQESDKSISLFHSNGRFWEASAYKTYEERQTEKLTKEQERLEQERLEQERLEQERLEQEQQKFIEELALSLEEEEQKTHNYYDVDKESAPTVSIDYGNVAEFYPIVRAIIRGRIRRS